MTVDEIVEDILKREGLFADFPADRGGPTKFGITQATLARHRGRPATRADVWDLGIEEARQIYRVDFVYPFAAVKDPALKALVVDSAVQHSPARATRWLQEALGVKPDGVIGAVTSGALGALGEAEVGAVYKAVLRRRIRFYGALITADPSQAVFAAGWADRVAGFV